MVGIGVFILWIRLLLILVRSAEKIIKKAPFLFNKNALWLVIVGVDGVFFRCNESKERRFTFVNPLVFGQDHPIIQYLYIRFEHRHYLPKYQSF